MGTALLLAAAPAGRGRAMDAASVLPALAAVPAGALTGTDTATVVELADPLDPQAVLTRLRAAAAAPGPLALYLAGQLQTDRRQRLPHLALARSTPTTLRYTGLPWHWLATELAPRRPGTTTVVADLAADPELWQRLAADPGALGLGPAVPLFARVTPFPRRGALTTPDYLRHFATLWRTGARPPLPVLHAEAATAAAQATPQTQTVLLSPPAPQPPFAAPPSPSAPSAQAAPVSLLESPPTHRLGTAAPSRPLADGPPVPLGSPEPASTTPAPRAAAHTAAPPESAVPGAVAEPVVLSTGPRAGGATETAADGDGAASTGAGLARPAAVLRKAAGEPVVAAAAAAVAAVPPGVLDGPPSGLTGRGVPTAAAGSGADASVTVGTTADEPVATGAVAGAVAGAGTPRGDLDGGWLSVPPSPGVSAGSRAAVSEPVAAGAAVGAGAASRVDGGPPSAGVDREASSRGGVRGPAGAVVAENSAEADTPAGTPLGGLEAGATSLADGLAVTATATAAGTATRTATATATTTAAEAGAGADGDDSSVSRSPQTSAAVQADRTVGGAPGRRLTEAADAASAVGAEVVRPRSDGATGVPAPPAAARAEATPAGATDTVPPRERDGADELRAAQHGADGRSFVAAARPVPASPGGATASVEPAPASTGRATVAAAPGGAGAEVEPQAAPRGAGDGPLPTGSRPSPLPPPSDNGAGPAESRPAPSGSAIVPAESRPAPSGSAAAPAESRPAPSDNGAAPVAPAPAPSVGLTASAAPRVAPSGSRPAGPAPSAKGAVSIPPRPTHAPGQTRPAADADPHPAILAAAMAGRHGEAAAMAAAWESDALRRYGPRSGEAVHWVEVRADLARLAGEPARSCELWIAAAQARLGMRQGPDEPDVEGAVDRAHHQWEQIQDPARARALGPALVELRRAVPGRHAGALAALQRKLSR
ncbi:hypothetical protein [Streptomyces roseoviridis]|uniref:hypothetical protein n=1 Tax=Streptomyces roseoviridis TaxID=67361 RepID=UPI0031EFCCDC